jgi:hypothetical protein
MGPSAPVSKDVPVIGLTPVMVIRGQIISGASADVKQGRMEEKNEEGRVKNEERETGE